MMRDSAIPEAGSHGGNETKTAEECRDAASECVVGNHSAIDEEGDEPEESNATHNAGAVVVFLLVIRAGHKVLQLLLRRINTSKHNQDEQLCTTKLLVEILVIQILMVPGRWIREIKTDSSP